MSASNGIIGKNDSLDTNYVNAVLQISGVHNWSGLCRHKNIKPTSKYKPVQYNKAGSMTDADFQAADWGYVYPNPMTAQGIVKFIVNGDSSVVRYPKTITDSMVALKGGWYYEKPTSYMRIGDFHGYNHNVSDDWFYFEPPYYQTIDESADVMGGNDRLSIAIGNAYGNYQIMPWEMDSMNNSKLSAADKKYFGIIVYKISGAGGGTITTRDNPRFIISDSTDLFLDSTISGSTESAEHLYKRMFFRNGTSRTAIDGTYAIIPVMAKSGGRLINTGKNEDVNGYSIGDNQSAIFYPLPCDYFTCEIQSGSETQVPTAYTNATWGASCSSVSINVDRLRFRLTLTGSLKDGASSASLNNLYGRLVSVGTPDQWSTEYFPIKTTSIGQLVGSNQTMVNEIISVRITDYVSNWENTAHVAIELATTVDGNKFYALASANLK